MKKIAIDIDNTVCETTEYVKDFAEYNNDKIMKVYNWKEIYEYIISDDK